MERTWINNTKQQKMAGQSKIKCDKNVVSFMRKKAEVINDDILDHDDFTLKLQLIVYHCTY